MRILTGSFRVDIAPGSWLLTIGKSVVTRVGGFVLVATSLQTKGHRFFLKALEKSCNL